MKNITLTLCLFAGIMLQFNTNAQNRIINTLAGNGIAGYSGDGGPATAAELNHPYGIAIDTSGNVYICDTQNNRIRKVNRFGIISTYAGNGVSGFSGDGGQATAAKIWYPAGIALDASGNLYIADLDNNRVRKVTTGGIITTVAGIKTKGFSGDGGKATAAQLNMPFAVAIDNDGNLYIADRGNARIREVNTGGIISTFAGNGIYGFYGDGGPATAAEFRDPEGLMWDKSGNLFIADKVNNKIRKIDTSGIISTVAGSGAASYTGDGMQATASGVDGPTGVAIDAAGNLFIADIENDRIRMVNTSGIISTVVGNGYGMHLSGGFSGDGGPATAAELFYPWQDVLDTAGNIYIADEKNNRIRFTSTITTGLNEPTHYVENVDNVKIYPNPSNGTFAIQYPVNGEFSTIEIMNIYGEKIYSKNSAEAGIVNTSGMHIENVNLSGHPPGIYFYRITREDGSIIGSGKIIID